MEAGAGFYVALDTKEVTSETLQVARSVLLEVMRKDDHDDFNMSNKGTFKDVMDGTELNSSSRNPVHVRMTEHQPS